MSSTQIADVIVPEIFDNYVQQITEQKTALIASGALVRDAQLDADLAGGGLIFNSPSWKDLANDVENVSRDDAPGVNDAVPVKTSAANEASVRLSRNQTWQS